MSDSEAGPIAQAAGIAEGLPNAITTTVTTNMMTNEAITPTARKEIHIKKATILVKTAETVVARTMTEEGPNAKTVITQTKATLKKNLTNLILGKGTQRPTGRTDLEVPRRQKIKSKSRQENLNVKR